MSTLLRQLKNSKTVRGRRWIIKRNKKDNITEVKMIYDPNQYKTFKNSKPMIGDKVLLKILENEKKKNNS